MIFRICCLPNLMVINLMIGWAGRQRSRARTTPNGMCLYFSRSVRFWVWSHRSSTISDTSSDPVKWNRINELDDAPCGRVGLGEWQPQPRPSLGISEQHHDESTST